MSSLLTNDGSFFTSSYYGLWESYYTLLWYRLWYIMIVMIRCPSKKQTNKNVVPVSHQYFWTFTPGLLNLTDTLLPDSFREFGRGFRSFNNGKRYYSLHKLYRTIETSRLQIKTVAKQSAFAVIPDYLARSSNHPRISFQRKIFHNFTHVKRERNKSWITFIS